MDDVLSCAEFWAWATDKDLRVTYLSANFERITSLPADDFVGLSRYDMIPAGMTDAMARRHRHELEKRLPFVGLRYEFNDIRGTRCFETSGTPTFDRRGRFRGYQGIARDVTEEVRDQERLEELGREQRILNVLFNHVERMANIGAWRYDPEQDVLTWSEQLYRLYGIPLGARVTLKEGLSVFAPDVAKVLQAAMEEAMGGERAFDLTLPFLSTRGEERYVRVLGECERRNGKPVSVFGTIQDVTSEKRREEERQRLAVSDPLTGLGNRNAFRMELAEALKKLGARKREAALCIFDLDAFKDINDFFGHDIGDKVLREVADWLRNTAEPGDLTARSGGDEFALLTSAATAAEAEEALRRRLQPLVRRSDFGHSITYSLSAGIAVFPDDGTTAEDLLRHADLALYEAKRGRRSTIERYEPQLLREAQNRFRLLADFREGLASGEIEAFYQPLVEFSSNQLSGFEALMRWRHPEKGIVPACELMPVFKDKVLSVELGEYMLRKIVGDLKAWRDAGIDFGRIGYNVTAADLQQEGFAPRLLGALAGAGLSSGDIVLEVTETSVIDEDNQAIRAHLEALRAAGVGVALDDFGTGFSSLTHLKSLPVGVLKIDRSFVKDLTFSPGDRAIVRALIGLGSELGYHIVAEGVETAAEAAFLHRAGCRYGQGYYFGRPMPADDVPEFIAEWDAAEEAVRRA
ncbi:EAL domain-containing protein [Afifella sp. H1R]|uniref:putative bifunctional diguanylate cyclase/phosphodiesterase n=1 Tax=Afifella sp. H1R TaxID=2908841 RepID=UPI001F38A9CA|nr:EAL domain-containing protein [Afifella sp. H1R]MCF1505638.1 EAL domain-containing protein [Afifella sp. H1R]